MSKSFAGRAASSAAFASSSADQRTLIPSPHTAGTRTPNHPLAIVNPSTPPNECPSTATGRFGGSSSATAAAIEPNEYRGSGDDRP